MTSVFDKCSLETYDHDNGYNITLHFTGDVYLRANTIIIKGDSPEIIATRLHDLANLIKQIKPDVY